MGDYDDDVYDYYADDAAGDDYYGGGNNEKSGDHGSQIHQRLGWQPENRVMMRRSYERGSWNGQSNSGGQRRPYQPTSYSAPSGRGTRGYYAPRPYQRRALCEVNDARLTLQATSAVKRTAVDQEAAPPVEQPRTYYPEDKLADYGKIVRRGQVASFLKGGAPVPDSNALGQLPYGNWESAQITAAPIAQWNVMRHGGILTTALSMREGVPQGVHMVKEKDNTLS